VQIDGIDLVYETGILSVTGDANLALDGQDIFMEVGDLQTQLPVTSGGGGFWHVGPLGIPPYEFPLSRKMSTFRFEESASTSKLANLSRPG